MVVTEAQHIAEIERGLAQELLRLHCESYGRGAAGANVHYLDDTVFCVLEDIELLPNEQFLIGAGQGDAVIEVRGRYRRAIEATFRAAVERATGRRVVSFVSATRLSPNWVVEVFRLAERASPDLDGLAL